MIGASESGPGALSGSGSGSGNQRLPTLTDLLYQLASRSVSSTTLVGRSLHAIHASQPTLNAFRVVLTESALADAAEADRRRAAGDTAPLLGIPIAVKDDVDIAGVPTAFGTEGSVPPATHDAEVVRRLKAAGAVIVGKTNTCELGQWPFTSGPGFGHTRNPWSRRHTPGGSSGGSAAAVASLVTAAIGSDGAGSIRIPAAWTHLVGIKPQRGRISTWPLPEAFNGITVNGVLARTVADAALVLDAASGNVDGDRHKPPPITASDYVGKAPGPLNIALSTRFPYTGFRPKLHPEILAATRAVGKQLELLGHTVVPGNPDYGMRLSWDFLARSTAGLRDWEERLGDGVVLDPRTVANLRLGHLLGQAILRSARRHEAADQRRVGSIFDIVDVVLAPTTAQPPPRPRLRPAQRLRHRPRHDRGVPADLPVERAGLAVDQRSGRLHLRRPADRRAADGPGQQRGHADLAGRRVGGGVRVGEQTAAALVGPERRHSPRPRPAGRPRRVGRAQPGYPSAMDQSDAPLLNALADYRDKNRYGFAPPGHRQGRGTDDRVLAVLGREPFLDDVLASGGLDDRRASNGYLQRAEDLMAEAVGAEIAWFSTCGSSLSVRAAMMAVAGGQGSLLVGRDSHKSIVAGLIFSGVQPRWITPRWDAERHFSHPPSPQQVEEAWDKHPDAAGALVVSPSPYGTCADIAGIAEVCHRRGKPLILDEAWGAHLPFHEDLPTWAMDAGADVCVVSVHKMGAGFEQGSVFHVQGDLIDRDRLSACADLLMTTSPNVLIYAAMDGWRRQMVQHGHQLLGAALDLARQVRDEIELIPDVEVLDDELLGVQASHDLDRMQVLIDVCGTGTSGYQAADWLREHARIDVGMSDHRRILATLSMADDKETLGRLTDALRAWRTAAQDFDPAPRIALPSPSEMQLETVELPRDAFFGRVQEVPTKTAAGRIAAEQITPYPPGIPAVVPGERLNDAVLDYLCSGVAAGMNLPDAADPSLQTIRVLA